MKKMKKALALSLALVMSATLFGCAPKEIRCQFSHSV